MTLDARRLLTTIEGRACSDLFRRVCPYKHVGMFVGFNTFHDLFDAWVFQDRLPRDRCQEGPGNWGAFPRVQVLEALARTRLC